MLSKLVRTALNSRLRRSADGFSLTESSALLGTAALLAAIVATMGFQSMESARGVAAREDVEQIGAAIGQLLVDHGDLVLAAADGSRIELLASAGEIPEAGQPAFRQPVDGRRVVALDTVLASNEIGLPETDTPWQSGWRGPYLRFDGRTDPWGNRYLVQLAGPDQPALLVLSAGPDGSIQTTGADAPIARRGDDIVFRLSLGN